MKKGANFAPFFLQRFHFFTYEVAAQSVALQC